jgi:hypothetical protein
MTTTDSSVGTKPQSGEVRQALINKLEAAESGSRELDEALKVILRPFSTEAEFQTAYAADSTAMWWVIGKDDYTTSLDAALALAERVLPGWCWEFRVDDNGADVQGAPAWWNEGLAAPDIDGVAAAAATPALALCAAILRASNPEVMK